VLFYDIPEMNDVGAMTLPNGGLALKIIEQEFHDVQKISSYVLTLLLMHIEKSRDPRPVYRTSDLPALET
jgi:hypothetical protein